MQDNQIYEPITEYENKYRDLHKKNVSDFFEELVKKSGVDEEANKETIKEIKKIDSKIKNSEERVKKFERIKVFLIVVTVLGFLIGAILGLVNYQGNSATNLVGDIFIIIGFVGLSIGMIILLVKKINPIINDTKNYLANLREELKEQYDKAWNQMTALNVLYDWSMSAKLSEKTMPILKLDPYFNSKRYEILHTKYNLADTSDVTKSVLFSQSGEIQGNPFVIGKMVNHYMGAHTYTGYLTITWTETVSTSNGTRTVTRSQTLSASVVKPKPAYEGRSFLMYGNEAAPDLTFSRSPSGIHKLSEKEIDRIVRSGAKSLERKERKAVSKGNAGFTALADEHFDVLFGADDRNHETQFRLLFTPLARREMLKVLMDKNVGFGDDFIYVKDRMLNVIIPEHLDKADIVPNPTRYVSYDLEQSRRIFNEYNNSYFKSIFFSFAPLFTIPLYQQHKPREFIYKDLYDSKLSCWEHESIANAFDQDILKHEDSVTYNIIKTSLISSTEGVDVLAVTALGYESFPEIEYVSVLGGDGRLHAVPVRWYRYEPVSKVTNIVVKTSDTLDRNNYIKNIMNNKDWQEFLSDNLSEEKGVEYRRNVLAYTSKDSVNLPSIEKLKNMLDRE